jgi:Bacteriophage holin family
MIKTFVKYLEQLLFSLKDTIILIMSILSAFLGPVNELIFSVFLLCLVDFATGVFSSYKTKTLITSSRMGDTIVKFALYGSVIIMFHYLDQHFINNIKENVFDSLLSKIIDGDVYKQYSSIKLASLAAFLMVIREFKSIDENWEKSFKWSFIKTFKNMFSFLNKFKTKKQEDEVSN